MFKAIGKWWRKRQRETDLTILWPILKAQTNDSDVAKAAFMFHCSNDRAWYEDFTEAELVAFITELK